MTFFYAKGRCRIFYSCTPPSPFSKILISALRIRGQIKIIKNAWPQIAKFSKIIAQSFTAGKKNALQKRYKICVCTLKMDNCNNLMKRQNSYKTPAHKLQNMFSFYFIGWLWVFSKNLPEQRDTKLLFLLNYSKVSPL